MGGALAAAGRGRGQSRTYRDKAPILALPPRNRIPVDDISPPADTRGRNYKFERFTEPSRRVVVLAQEEARMLDHNYIGTEHLLLGLIHEGEGVAATALESLGISLEAVRQQVEEIIGR